LAKSPSKKAGERLHAAAVRQARAPDLYARMGAPDTTPGRFELLTLHVVLLLDRLKDGPADVQEVRQNLFDAYVSNLDGAIREMGVADLSVGKHMRRLGQAFYGRAQAYDTAFEALPDEAPLAEVVARVLFPAEPRPSCAALAAYVARVRAALARQDAVALAAGEPLWPAPLEDRS
jgi:cytochrome b pre-mRNA-processing protein 3